MLAILAQMGIDVVTIVVGGFITAYLVKKFL